MLKKIIKLCQFVLFEFGFDGLPKFDTWNYSLQVMHGNVLQSRLSVCLLFLKPA